MHLHMKWEEIKVEEYLKSKGYKDIVFEPDGNITPDFLIEASIAIEVRRLNKHIESKESGKLEPLEDLEYKLIPKITTLLDKYVDVSHNNSAYVLVDYSRPLKPSKQLIIKIKEFLDEHLSHLNDIGNEFDIRLNNNLHITIRPTNRKYNSAYVLGVQADDDSGGMVVSDVYENLKLVIKEKEQKVKPHYSKYSTWWLILVDQIGFGLDDYDIVQLKRLEITSNIFNRIVLLNPLDPTIGRIINN